MWVGIGITWKLSVVMLASLGHWNPPIPIGITATTLGIIETGRSNRKTLDFKLDSG